LHDQANNSKNIGNFDWNSPVIVHDAENGDEYNCDTYFFDNKLTLAINMETVFLEKGQS
jgi:hypothetical protein